MDAVTISKKLKNIKSYHGFIFAKDINESILTGYYAVNLDRSKPLNGTHWVGMAVDVDKKTIFYFDSFGAPPPEEVISMKTNGRFRVFYSSRQHQKPTDTNCGEWVIHFIHYMHKNNNNFQAYLFSLI